MDHFLIRNEKRSLISWGLRVPIWDNIFHSRVLRLSDLPRCRKRPQNAMCCLEWLERLKCLATGLNASLSFLSTSRRYSRNQSPSRLPFPPMYNFLQEVQVMQWLTLAELHLTWSVILVKLLSPNIFSMLWMKEQVYIGSECIWKFRVGH